MTQQPTAEQWAEVGRACQALAVALSKLAKEIQPVEGSTVRERPERILVAGPTREAVDGWVEANREHLWPEGNDTHVTRHVIAVDSPNHLRGRQWDHVFIVGSHLPEEHRREIMVGLRGGGKMRVASTLDRLRPDWRDS